MVWRKGCLSFASVTKPRAYSYPTTSQYHGIVKGRKTPYAFFSAKLEKKKSEQGEREWKNTFGEEARSKKPLSFESALFSFSFFKNNSKIPSELLYRFSSFLSSSGLVPGYQD